MKKILTFSFLLFAALLFLPQKVFAETLRLETIEDTFIREDHPDTNYGSFTSLLVSNAPTKCYAFVKFEGFLFLPGAVLDSATLHFYIFSHSYADEAWFRIGPAVFTGGWSEDVPKWSGPYPAMYMPAGGFAEDNISLSEGWKEVDITNVVQIWLDGVLEDEGLYFSYTEMDDFLVSIRSKESGSNPAYLELEYHTTGGGEEVVPPEEDVVDGDGGEVVDEGEEDTSTTEEDSTSEGESDESEDTEEDETTEGKSARYDLFKIALCISTIILFIIVVILLVYIILKGRRKKRSAAEMQATSSK